jgi:hypothetical protein
MYGCIIPVPFKTSLYICRYKKSSYKFEIRWTMHEPQSIVLKIIILKWFPASPLYLEFKQCCAAKWQRISPTHPPPSPVPRGNVAGVWEEEVGSNC